MTSDQRTELHDELDVVEQQRDLAAYRVAWMVMKGFTVAPETVEEFRVLERRHDELFGRLYPSLRKAQ
jgi:hypothetical protein